jgi:putative PIN family toxin of toxin-antitoxin system
MKFKVVADAHFFVAAYLNPNSSSAKIMNMMARRELIFLWSKEIFDEVERALTGAGVKAKFLNKAKNKIFIKEHEVWSRERVEEARGSMAENKFFEAAAAGSADYILTDEGRLLALGSFKQIPIITPNNFWRIIKP